MPLLSLSFPASPRRRLRWLALALACLAWPALHAQNKGTPGQFDFYVLNVASGDDFCNVPGAGPACKPPHGFVLHGLWTQNNDGTYPVNCSDEAGPQHLERFLDLTPDLPLLQHEWDKHGTCTAVGPERFFAMERQAFDQLKLPLSMWHRAPEHTRTVASLLLDLHSVNPGFPPGSVLLSCKQGRLTAVEACFSKDLKPIACRALPSCPDTVVTLGPTP